MANPDLHEREPHDEAEALLPWYATGQLEERDRVRVEAHLSSCSDCREQLSVERRLVREFRAMSPETETGWSRIRARIQSPTPVPSSGARMVEWLRTLAKRPALAALATAQLAFVLVAGGLLISLSRPVYHTLGSAPPASSADVIVIFTPDTRMRDAAETLRSARASIVEGPTDANAYLLHVEPAQRQSALSKLRSASSVELAQPIDGVAQ